MTVDHLDCLDDSLSIVFADIMVIEHLVSMNNLSNWIMISQILSFIKGKIQKADIILKWKRTGRYILQEAIPDTIVCILHLYCYSDQINISASQSSTSIVWVTHPQLLGGEAIAWHGMYDSASVAAATAFSHL